MWCHGLLLRGCLLRMEAPLFDFFFIFSFLGVKQKQSHFPGRIFCHAGTRTGRKRGRVEEESEVRGVVCEQKEAEKGRTWGDQIPPPRDHDRHRQPPVSFVQEAPPQSLLPTSSSSSCRPSLTLSAQSFSAQQPQRNEASKSVPFPATEKQDREGREERGGAGKERKGAGGAMPIRGSVFLYPVPIMDVPGGPLWTLNSEFLLLPLQVQRYPASHALHAPSSLPPPPSQTAIDIRISYTATSNEDDREVQYASSRSSTNQTPTLLAHTTRRRVRRTVSARNASQLNMDDDTGSTRSATSSTRIDASLRNLEWAVRTRR